MKENVAVGLGVKFKKVLNLFHVAKLRGEKMLCVIYALC